jgi:hypothetical protein
VVWGRAGWVRNCAGLAAGTGAASPVRVCRQAQSDKQPAPAPVWRIVEAQDPQPATDRGGRPRASVLSAGDRGRLQQAEGQLGVGQARKRVERRRADGPVRLALPGPHAEPVRARRRPHRRQRAPPPHRAPVPPKPRPLVRRPARRPAPGAQPSGTSRTTAPPPLPPENPPPPLSAQRRVAMKSRHRVQQRSNACSHRFGWTRVMSEAEAGSRRAGLDGRGGRQGHEKLPTWLPRRELGRLWSLERHYLPGCAAGS